MRLEEENLSKRLLENGISFALRTARKLSIRIFKKVLFKFFTWLLTVLAPVWVPVVIGLLAAFFVYFAMFMVPKYISSQMVLSPDGGNYVIFNYGKEDVWSMERDQKLYKRYADIQNNFLGKFMEQEELAKAEIKEKGGNAATKETVSEVWGQFMGDVPSQGAIIVAEQDQVKPHAVPWSLLAAVDRVVCDPIIHGRHGVEEKDNSSWWQKLLGNTPMTGRDPNPDKHFNTLKSDIKMQEFQLYYYHTWTETDSEGNSESYSEEYKYNINLLTSAKAYNADYGYQWKEKVIEHSSKTSYTKIIVPEFIGVTKSGEPYGKLKALLDGYDLNSKMNLELVLQLAANMDESFAIDEITSNDFSDMYLEDIVYDGPLGKAHMPASGRVTSDYGWRIHPVTKLKTFHTGIDIGADEGSPVMAYQSGVVVFAGVNGGYGKCIIIDHGTFRTLYSHLSSYDVQQGEQVTGGQEIGKVGQTGVATGPHLHFEIRIKEGNNIKPVDPAPYLKLK